jgi:calcineurin-like phosphoesterase family protein
MPTRITLNRFDNIFFTSDTHFNHHNIIKYENRPFSNVEEMNEALINNWNEVVSKKDIIFILGDFIFKHMSFNELCSKLNGKKFFVRGNHDYAKEANGWPDIIELNLKGEAFLVLTHYPMLSWNRSFHGSWNLFGHTHSKYIYDNSRLALNVGTDCHNFRPISYLEVKKKILTIKEECDENKKWFCI